MSDGHAVQRDLLALVTATVNHDTALVREMLHGMSTQEILDTLIVAVGELAGMASADGKAAENLAGWRRNLEERHG